MNRRLLLQNAGLVIATAGLASGITNWLNHGKQPKTIPRGIYVQMGTSITAGLHAPGGNMTPITVGARLNLTPINVGFDGACATTIQEPARDAFSLGWLVDAIVSGDWSAQEKAAASYEPAIRVVLARLQAVDFHKVTLLGLEYGPNDFTLAAPIGTSIDASRETFKGALNYSIRKLLVTYPDLRLFLITPSWRLNFEDLDSDTHPNARGTFLRDYVDAVVETAALNHVPCLDMWRTLGLGINNYKTFTFDGTHPNEHGAIRRGESVAAFINSVFEIP
jgi:lysophospholipase L1-like esterase